MTFADPSPESLTVNPHALHRARSAGLVAAELLATPGVIGAAVLRSDESPVIAVRVAALAQARDLAARLDLTWHTQATGSGCGALWVHAFEGILGFPVTLYALGERDDDPAVATLEGTVAVPLLLAGLIL